MSKVNEILEDLRAKAGAKAVLVVDGLGEPVAMAGDSTAVDASSLVELVGSKRDATEGLAKLIREEEFSILFHEDDLDNVHVQLVVRNYLLAVVFRDRDGLGRVRLCTKRAAEELAGLLAADDDSGPSQDGESGGGGTPGTAAAGLFWRQRQS